jgi:hypothetical protein
VMVRGNNALSVTLKPGEVYTLDTNSSNPDPQGGGTSNALRGDMGLVFAVTAAIIAGVVLGVVNANTVSPSGP